MPFAVVLSVEPLPFSSPVIVSKMTILLKFGIKFLIIPIFHLSGIKIILLEAMSYGLPIVSNHTGGMGFENIKTWWAFHVFGIFQNR